MELDVVTIPSTEHTGLWYSKSRDEYFWTTGMDEAEMFSLDWTDDHEQCHMYFVSDKEIKEHDWFLNHNNHPEYHFNNAHNTSMVWGECKKITASTMSLKSTVYGAKPEMPFIPGSFIEKFVNRPVKKVSVATLPSNPMDDGKDYLILVNKDVVICDNPKISDRNTDDKFSEIAIEIENQWGMHGLAGGLYEEFAREIYNKMIDHGNRN